METTNQNYPHLYHSCAKDLNNFIEIELIAPKKLSNVKIYNRIECCGERLAGVVLETYDSFGSLINSYTLTGKSLVTVDLVNNVVG